MKEFRYVGDHSASLEGGRMVGHGEFTGPIDPDLPTNAQLIEDGHLIDVPNGTYKKEYEQEPPDAPELLHGGALQERARELDVKDRSKMSADKLREAVADAEQNDEESETA